MSSHLHCNWFVDEDLDIPETFHILVAQIWIPQDRKPHKAISLSGYLSWTTDRGVEEFVASSEYWIFFLIITQPRLVLGLALTPPTNLKSQAELGSQGVDRSRLGLGAEGEAGLGCVELRGGINNLQSVQLLVVPAGPAVHLGLAEVQAGD